MEQLRRGVEDELCRETDIAVIFIMCRDARKGSYLGALIGVGYAHIWMTETRSV